MRLLHVISSTNPAHGGPIEGVKQLHSAYSALGIQAHVVSCDAPDSPWLTQPGLLQITALGPGKGRFGYASALLPWLRQNAHRYDAIIVNGIWQYHCFAAHQALKGTGIPYFVFTHGMLDPWFKRTYPLKHLKKWLYWPWGQYPALRDANAVIFTCEEERLLARESFWLYKVREAVTSYGTASPTADAHCSTQLFVGTFPEVINKRVILFLGRIHEKKGCDLLIEAFARVASHDGRLHLVMAGPDQTGWAAELKARAELLGVAGRITWAGMLEGDLKWGAFHACEVFALPSHQENFGIAVAEALAVGKAVLISNKVNIWREIESAQVGFVGTDDLAGTEQVLRRWLDLSAQEREAMSLRAKACFMEKFHIRRAAERLVEIIKEYGA